MDASEPQVLLDRVRHDEGVNDAFRDHLCQRVPQQVLHRHRLHVRERRDNLPHVRNVRQHCLLQRSGGRGASAQDLSCPAVDRTLELRRRILCARARAMVRHFPVGYAMISYHDGKAENRAPMYFEGPVERLCSQIRPAFLEKICLESDR